MIVFIVYNLGIFTIEPESNSPVSTDIDGPHIGSISFQFVKPQTWKIHILRLPCGVEPAKYQAESVHMRCLDSGDTSSFKEAPETFMLKTPNHIQNVTYYVPGVNYVE